MAEFGKRKKIIEMTKLKKTKNLETDDRMDLKEIRKQERETDISRRKEHVLQAALFCFIQYGIENTAIAQIARKASVGEATIYRYFTNKESIAIACGTMFWKRTAVEYEDLTKSSAYQKMNGLEQIRALTERAVEIFDRETDCFRFLHDFDGYLLSHQVDREKLVDYEWVVDSLRPCLCSAIELGRKDGSVAAIADTLELYYTLTNAIFGLMQKLGGAGALLAGDTLIDRKRKVELLVELLLKGLQGGGAKL